MSTLLKSLLNEQVIATEAEQANIRDAIIGRVTDNEDPLHLGRVRVVLPVLSDTHALFWLPVVSVGGANNQGWFFLPEIDDEVLVMFEHGNIESGYVLGSLWNGVHTPPSDNQNGKNNRRLIKSRAGSRLEFDDTAGEEKIIIESGSNRITFDSAKNSILIEADGDVCFYAPKGTLKIVAEQATMKAGGKFVLRAQAAVDGSFTNATFKANARIDLSGLPITELNPLAPPKPAEAATATPAEVPDPYGS